MGIYREGEKVLGFWGALHPLSFGKIEKIADGWCTIGWNDNTKSIERVGEIFHDLAGACGIGVYFCDTCAPGFDIPDEWFEIKAEVA